jgi:hypothetical protein
MASKNANGCVPKAENGFGYDFSTAIPQRWQLHFQYILRALKSGFYLWMVKPESSQSSGFTHVYETNQKSLNEGLSDRILKATVFWDRKGVSMAELMQQEITITSEVDCKALRNCVGPCVR